MNIHIGKTVDFRKRPAAPVRPIFGAQYRSESVQKKIKSFFLKMDRAFQAMAAGSIARH